MQGMDDHTGTLQDVGDILRDWRHRRHLSQRALADAAGISASLLGAIETGRDMPSRDTLMFLSEALDIPLRARNVILNAAGYDAAFPIRVLGDPVLADIAAMVEQIVKRQAPCPALAIDRRWKIVATNGVLRHLIAGVDPTLLAKPLNWARIVLHPAGLAPRIANLSEWRDHMSMRLRRLFDRTGDADVADLLEEIADYPIPATRVSGQAADPVALPLRLMTLDGLLTFYSITSVFGSAVDVTLAELSIDTLYPADDATAALMRQYAALPATTG